MLRETKDFIAVEDGDGVKVSCKNPLLWPQELRLTRTAWDEIAGMPEASLMSALVFDYGLGTNEAPLFDWGQYWNGAGPGWIGTVDREGEDGEGSMEDELLRTSLIGDRAAHVAEFACKAMNAYMRTDEGQRAYAELLKGIKGRFDGMPEDGDYDKYSPKVGPF